MIDQDSGAAAFQRKLDANMMSDAELTEILRSLPKSNFSVAQPDLLGRYLEARKRFDRGVLAGQRLRLTQGARRLFRRLRR